MSPTHKSYLHMDPRLVEAIERKLADALVGEAQERKALQTRLDEVERRMSNVETAVDALGLDVKDNTELTKGILNNTEEMVELFKTAKGGFKVVGWFGTFAKWAGGAVGGIVAIWAAIWAIAQNIRGGH